MRLVVLVFPPYEPSVDSPETTGVVFGVDVGGRGCLFFKDPDLLTGVHMLSPDPGESGKLGSVSDQ